MDGQTDTWNAHHWALKLRWNFTLRKYWCSPELFMHYCCFRKNRAGNGTSRKYLQWFTFSTSCYIPNWIKLIYFLKILPTNIPLWRCGNFIKRKPKNTIYVCIGSFCFGRSSSLKIWCRKLNSPIFRQVGPLSNIFRYVQSESCLDSVLDSPRHSERFWSHTFEILAKWFGSPSCWQMNRCPSLRSRCSGAAFHPGYLWDIAAFIFPSILTSMTVPAAAKHPYYSMVVLPPPCFNCRDGIDLV